MRMGSSTVGEAPNAVCHPGGARSGLSVLHALWPPQALAYSSRPRFARPRHRKGRRGQGGSHGTGRTPCAGGASRACLPDALSCRRLSGRFARRVGIVSMSCLVIPSMPKTAPDEMLLLLLLRPPSLPPSTSRSDVKHPGAEQRLQPPQKRAAFAVPIVVRGQVRSCGLCNYLWRASFLLTYGRGTLMVAPAASRRQGTCCSYHVVSILHV